MANATKKKKRKHSRLSLRRGDETHNLHIVAGRWVSQKGGTAIMSEGPFIIDDGESIVGDSYYVAIKIMGRKPVKQEAKS